MANDSLSQKKIQLNKQERKKLEDTVTEMRERVEDNVSFQLAQRDLNNKPENNEQLNQDSQKLVEAIEFEAADGESWNEALDKYVTGVGYTIVNRLAALRCMEVRNFIDQEVTVFKNNGLTPAAETLVNQEFLLEDEAILKSYHNACDNLTEEVEILFDRSSRYSLIDPDKDTFEKLCANLDSIPEQVWMADDVLGWVYEYYNTSQLSDVRKRMRTGDFDAGDVAVANQFYTPHWVARVLTDNAIGKPHLKSKSELEECIEEQRRFEKTKKMNRDPEFAKTPSLSELCTYLVPSDDNTHNVSRHPSEIQVLDPACGSGHFLLYAFDVLERIWRDTTNVQPADIPAKILENNLYGIDIDQRACQLAAFNLYLKARRRAKKEGANSFKMPSVGIVCADNQITETERAYEVIEELADANDDFAAALETVLDDFRSKNGLGSLLDVKGTLESEAVENQTAISDWTAEIPSLTEWLDRLHEKINEKEEDRFFYQNLQSFLRIILFLTKDYDTILMNPPYGGHRRMPKGVKNYVKEHYDYKPEYYANFLEQSGRLLKPTGQIGMLVPRSFMYKESFEDVREELIKDSGEYDFDFLLEFGKGILDNATVRTVGTVLTAGKDTQNVGEFIQLSDLDPNKKEETFASVINNEESAEWRHHTVNIDQFQKIPGGMLTYWTPSKLRNLYTSDKVFDADQANLERVSIGSTKKGIDTGNNSRFVRKSWECIDEDNKWRPYAKGGERSWFYYPDRLRVFWEEDGHEIDRNESSTIRNREYQGTAAVTWPLIKDSGHRFAQFDSGGISDNGGPCFYPDSESHTYLTSLLNSKVYTGLMLAQTPERQWNLSDIAILPYFDIESSNRERLINSASCLSELVNQFESFNLKSGRYQDTLNTYDCFNDFVNEREETVEALVEEMEIQKNEIDSILAQEFGISENVLDAIEREAKIRYGEFKSIPYRSSDTETNEESCCERLLSFLVLQAVQESNDGIIEIYSEFKPGNELYEDIRNRVGNLFRTKASEILASIDEVLGSKAAESEPYPNIGTWLRNDYFETHLSQFDNKPIVWKLQTSRLVANPVDEGFQCLIDYKRIEPAMFDRLETQYLDSYKAELRNRRQSADQRRSDESLSTNERSKATDEFDRCKSSLQQIEEFQESIQNLIKGDSRNWEQEERKLAKELEQDVKRFRDITENKIHLYEELMQKKSSEELEEIFSSSFVENFQQNKENWIRSLDDLEAAAREYQKSGDKSVKAHYYDLFIYFGEDMKGSVWPTSTGILSLGYYPKKKAEDFLDEENRPVDTITDQKMRILAQIASNFEKYESLADNIEIKCGDIAKKIPSDWSRRAISEITNEGYQPNLKHGVKINITPLAEAKIVPESVDKKVI